MAASRLVFYRYVDPRRGVHDESGQSGREGPRDARREIDADDVRDRRQLVEVREQIGGRHGGRTYLTA
ncbi:hypothetical protein [Micromonospora sp. LOL_023]|uniref:hypothetical protein n=1 Tax=Micromonospora sp. LOL_023 TaxID=3345418 RepID=UPI003A89CAE8